MEVDVVTIVVVFVDVPPVATGIDKHLHADDKATPGVYEDRHEGFGFDAAARFSLMTTPMSSSCLRTLAAGVVGHVSPLLVMVVVPEVTVVVIVLCFIH